MNRASASFSTDTFTIVLRTILRSLMVVESYVSRSALYHEIWHDQRKLEEQETGHKEQRSDQIPVPDQFIIQHRHGPVQTLAELCQRVWKQYKGCCRHHTHDTQ
jgi:hypothetical protein